jgi:hypothetical protein
MNAAILYKTRSCREAPQHREDSWRHLVDRKHFDLITAKEQVE